MAFNASFEALQAQLAERDRELARLRAEMASWDAGERARVEEQLRQSEAKARDLIRYAPTGIYEVDFRTGRFRSVNDAMCEILGYTRDELFAMTAFDLLDDEGKALFADRIRRTLAGEKVDTGVEYRVKLKDGRVIYGVLSTTITYTDGKPDGAFVIAHDVTERRLAAQELERRVAERTAELTRANEELLRGEAALQYQAALLANISDAVVATDPYRRITYINQAAVEQTGLQAAEVIGRTLTEAFRLEFVDVDQENAYRQLYAEGRWRGELIVHRKDGTTFYADSTLVALKDEAGRALGYIGVNRDITERKRLEAALRAGQEQAQSFSRRLVATVENERRTLARELHDHAGQSLTALKFSLARLERDVDGAGEHAPRFAELLQLADEVMDGLHRVALDLRPVSLDRYGLVPALRQLIEHCERQSGVHMDLALAGAEERRLPSDVETAVYRIVQEALANVMRHAGARQAAVVVAIHDDRVTAVVEDDGQGFDVDVALRKDRLGLLGMRERAEMLGGTLTLESRPGSGATIVAAIPFPPPVGA